MRNINKSFFSYFERIFNLNVFEETMTDLISAAQRNDLESLRRFLDLEKVQNPDVFCSPRPASMPRSTVATQDASYAAARYNCIGALNMLLDSGCVVMPGA
jgi:hypothetical protein